MKKLMSILLAVLLAATMVSAVAFAENETFPQPEGGKKFESDWAIPYGLVQINYEEEGYRVYVDIFNTENGTGNIWEYNCTYNSEKDALEAISALKRGYTFDLDTAETTDGEVAYDLFLEDGMDINFTITAEGKLHWNDSVEFAGEDLEFLNIGSFEGRWANDAEGVWAEFTWLGKDDEDTFWYDVNIHRDGADGAYEEFLMHGFYNNETGKLECMGTSTEFTMVDGVPTAGEEDGASYDAFFSKTEDGNLLYEAVNTVVLEYQFVTNDGSEG